MLERQTWWSYGLPWKAAAVVKDKPGYDHTASDSPVIEGTYLIQREIPTQSHLLSLAGNLVETVLTHGVLTVRNHRHDRRPSPSR